MKMFIITYHFGNIFTKKQQYILICIVLVDTLLVGSNIQYLIFISYKL